MKRNIVLCLITFIIINFGFNDVYAETRVLGTGWIWSYYPNLPGVNEITKIIISKDAPSVFDEEIAMGEGIRGLVVGDDLTITAGADDIALGDDTCIFGNASFDVMYQKAYTIENLDQLDTSATNSMMWLFKEFGKISSNPIVLDLTGMNVSNVNNMYGLFDYVGNNATAPIYIDVSSWDISSAGNMSYLFSNVGSEVEDYPITIKAKNWKIPEDANISFLFNNIGQKNKNSITVDLEGWDVSDVTSMESMFNGFARYAEGPINLDISDWDVSNVTNMAQMFTGFAKENKTPIKLDLSKWDVSNVENFEDFMLESFSNATDVDINFSNKVIKDSANVTNMFQFVTGEHTGNIHLDLSNLLIGENSGFMFGEYSNSEIINNPNLILDFSGYGAVEDATCPFKNGKLTVNNVGSIIIPNKTAILDSERNIIDYVENSSTEFFYNRNGKLDIEGSIEAPFTLEYTINYHLNGGKLTNEEITNDTYQYKILEDQFIEDKFTNLLSKDEVCTEGKKLKGWYDNPELSGNPVSTVLKSSYVTNSIDLYAAYEDIKEPSSGGGGYSSRHQVVNTGVK